jgi:hypothetical protein
MVFWCSHSLARLAVCCKGGHPSPKYMSMHGERKKNNVCLVNKDVRIYMCMDRVDTYMDGNDVQMQKIHHVKDVIHV